MKTRVLFLPIYLLLCLNLNAQNEIKGANLKGRLFRFEKVKGQWLDPRNVDVWVPNDFDSSGKTRYASRMFVGYDDINDSSKYTIYIKWATLEETEKVYEVLDKYGKSKRNSDSNSSIATSDESVVDSDSDDDESENN
jgi:hypothetical protein